MRGFLGVVAVIALVASSCAVSSDPLGVEGLARELEVEGAAVSALRSPYPPYEELSGSRWLLCIDGYEALVFEYSSEGDRRADAADTAPNLEGEIDLFWGTIGWWATSNVLVAFHYEPTRPGPVASLLDDVMGPELGRTGFALGKAPEEIPLSENCS
ncbi:MAG: hypothetical protein M3094_03335 [Actinomycetia bacterium]|nr:hypothetical protein [Actinomycetes bacterium]